MNGTKFNPPQQRRVPAALLGNKSTMLGGGGGNQNNISFDAAQVLASTKKFFNVVP
jgi:hypothetical protein